jgi:hypothetical protein
MDVLINLSNTIDFKIKNLQTRLDVNITNEDALFYLGNSIVVNVPLTFVPVIETWFMEI